MPLTVSKGVTIRIADEILSRIDLIQPTHLTRKGFVNQLLLEAVELRELKSLQAPQAAAK